MVNKQEEFEVCKQSQCYIPHWVRGSVVGLNTQLECCAGWVQAFQEGQSRKVRRRSCPLCCPLCEAAAGVHGALLGTQ